jgi:hypothetical protein
MLTMPKCFAVNFPFTQTFLVLSQSAGHQQEAEHQQLPSVFLVLEITQLAVRIVFLTGLHTG